jgi:flagellar biosynthetic protein FlhB
MSGGADNKTERPTSRRLQKAREKGQVARSREVASVMVLVGVLFMLYYFGGNLLAALRVEMKRMLSIQVPQDITVNYVSALLGDVSFRIAIALGPVLLTAVVMSTSANVLQGGLTLSWEALGLHFNKLNPANGFGRLFSKNGLVELVKGIVLLIIVSTISYRVVVQYLPLYPRLILMDVRQLFYWTATISFEVLLRVSVFLVVLAVGDYAFQKYRYLEQLKMTKQEIKDERKDMEGDSLTRGRIRRIQREMASKRMMAEVPKADVVITNPTHYAVALAYKMDTMDAPRVIAKGVGILALKIKELAQQHKIPLVENKPLAQTLYKTVEIGESIPGSLYKAVAEILAYVYKARNAWR